MFKKMKTCAIKSAVWAQKVISLRQLGHRKLSLFHWRRSGFLVSQTLGQVLPQPSSCFSKVSSSMSLFVVVIKSK